MTLTKMFPEKGAKPELARLEVGDVLASTWGYEQTNVDFFLVTKRTPKMVTLAYIEVEKTPGKLHHLTYTAVPAKDDDGNWITFGELKRKVHVSDWRETPAEFVRIESYANASKWGGEPVNGSSWH